MFFQSETGPLQPYTCDPLTTLTRLFFRILPISDETKCIPRIQPNTKNLLQFTLFIRANTLFQSHFNCPFCTNLLSQQIATAHILFDCNIQSIIKNHNKNWLFFTSATIAQEWKKLYSNFNFYLEESTGVNISQKTTPLKPTQIKITTKMRTAST